ncbi:dienelactone hydrolase family protein [Indioceanicola profundi]|uniref:dienelactone hydrolase family protein n=1 Tax=Indioceanicola profundi TaxID=2220096 RepID=UPI000E6AD533|nr:dienelactone hydrolase family protein [Indioceanicola profundi]
MPTLTGPEDVQVLNAPLSRRTFAITSVAAGFALSVDPAGAQTVITTPSDGLVAGEVSIPVRDGTLPAYRAMPEGDGPFPTVLVVQEIFGVHEHMQDVCRRFAKAGYFAVAPELYARQGDPRTVADVQTLFSTIVSKVPDDQVMADLDETVAWAKETGKADTESLGITGFCWGGRIVWLYAAHNPALKAGVAWYGRLVPRGEPSPLQPRHPIDLAAELKAPVLGLYGGQDQGIPVETVEQMRAALAEAGKTGSEIVVYPEAPHGFYADYRPSFREDAAQDGWQRCLEWFKQHGVA